MPIRFKVYKNSVLATVCSIIGSVFIGLGVLAVVAAIVDHDIDELGGMIAACVFLFLIGFGFSKLAAKISENKQFRTIRKNFREKGVEAQIISSIPVALQAYKVMPCPQMLKYIASLNPAAAAVIQGGNTQAAQTPQPAQNGWAAQNQQPAQSDWAPQARQPVQSGWDAQDQQSGWGAQNSGGGFENSHKNF